MIRLLRLAISLAPLAFLLAPSAATAQFANEIRLTGTAEVPPANNDFQGVCNVIMDVGSAVIQVSCSHDVLDATAAHIHRGEIDESGPVVHNLGDPTSPIQTVISSISDQDVSDFLNGNFYINVHNPAFPAGAIRGQILPDPPVGGAFLRFPLEPGQEVPPVSADTSGECFVSLSAGQESLMVDCQHDAENTTGAHIHDGARGTNGEIIFDLGDPASPIQATIDLTDPANEDVLPAILAGTAYVNVHTVANPGGEIRGQIEGCVSSDTTLCLRNRFEVTVEWASSVHEFGFGKAVTETDESGMFWFFQPNNLELLIKVLDGCAINNHFWVFWAATTDVAFVITVRDTVTGETVTYENDLGERAGSRNDIEALATCDAE